MKAIFPLIFVSFAAFAEPVNINQADAETISESLTGIGPKKAQAIVEYRKENGDFNSLEDLQKVKGIGEKTVKLNEKDIRFSEVVPEKKSENDGNAKKPAKADDSHKAP